MRGGLKQVRGGTQTGEGGLKQVRGTQAGEGGDTSG